VLLVDDSTLFAQRAGEVKTDDAHQRVVREAESDGGSATKTPPTS
jgi:hypothetical protein